MQKMQLHGVWLCVCAVQYTVYIYSMFLCTRLILNHIHLHFMQTSIFFCIVSLWYASLSPIEFQVPPVEHCHFLWVHTSPSTLTGGHNSSRVRRGFIQHIVMTEGVRMALSTAKTPELLAFCRRLPEVHSFKRPCNNTRYALWEGEFNGWMGKMNLDKWKYLYSVA